MRRHINKNFEKRSALKSSRDVSIMLRWVLRRTIWERKMVGSASSGLLWYYAAVLNLSALLPVQCTVFQWSAGCQLNICLCIFSPRLFWSLYSSGRCDGSKAETALRCCLEGLSARSRGPALISEAHTSERKHKHIFTCRKPKYYLQYPQSNSIHLQNA